MIRADRTLTKKEYVDLVGEKMITFNPGYTHPVTDARGAHANTISEPVTKDSVYHPPHYARRKMQPIEYIAANNLPWWEANVVKYIARWDAKDGLKDLYKARSYLDMKIREIEGIQRFWDKPVTEERRLNGAS